MSAIDDFQTALASAASSFAAGDYNAARRYVITARIYLAQIPNTTADGASAQWREDLANIENSINMESGRSTRAVHVSCEFAP